VGDRPITSGYRNDARRIDTDGVSTAAHDTEHNNAVALADYLTAH
jgi:uncharacterized protein YeaO (DUF488 family)